MKNRFLQYIPCENNDLEVPNIENSNQKSMKKLPGNKPNNKQFLKHFETQKLAETSPEITPKSTQILSFATSCPSCCSHGPPGWSRGAKIASQGAFETPKWSPKVLPRCQNGSKKEAPRLPNGNPEKSKGAGGRGRSH